MAWASLSGNSGHLGGLAFGYLGPGFRPYVAWNPMPCMCVFVCLRPGFRVAWPAARSRRGGEPTGRRRACRGRLSAGPTPGGSPAACGRCTACKRPGDRPGLGCAGDLHPNGVHLLFGFAPKSSAAGNPPRFRVPWAPARAARGRGGPREAVGVVGVVDRPAEAQGARKRAAWAAFG